jgi:hypothetical protein
MAERRMFAKTIVLSDAFLDMPMSARCLYFTLGMLADDDGFVNAPRSIMRQCGSSEDDMRILISKKFVLEFESGVIVIKHWRINNYLRNDRYVETKYVKEKAMLVVDEKGGYKPSEASGIPPGIPSMGIPRLGQDSIGKDSINRPPPQTPQEVADYCREERLGLTEEEAKRFFTIMEAQGWKHRNGKPIRDWRMLVATWAKSGGNAGKQVTAQQYGQRDYTEEELLAVSDDLIAEARRNREENG